MSLSISLSSSSLALVLNNLRLSTGVPGTESFRDNVRDSEGVSLGLDTVEFSSGLVSLPCSDFCLTSSTFGASTGFGGCSMMGLIGGSSTTTGFAACSFGALIGAIICSTEN